MPHVIAIYKMHSSPIGMFRSVLKNGYIRANSRADMIFHRQIHDLRLLLDGKKTNNFGGIEYVVVCLRMAIVNQHLSAHIFRYPWIYQSALVLHRSHQFSIEH